MLYRLSLDFSWTDFLPFVEFTLTELFPYKLRITMAAHWPPVSDVAAVTKARRETHWNLLGCSKVANRSQPLTGRSSPYMWNHISGQPTFAWSLAVSWAATLYIHFWGLLPPDRILPVAKFTLRPSLAFSYIGSVTARHFSSGRQPNFAAWYKEWNYQTFADGVTYIRQGGHHVEHWPTF